jgi:hypothetical protein
VSERELWNLHVDRLRLWLWLIARLTGVAALVGLLRWLGVVSTLWWACEQTVIDDIADIRTCKKKTHPKEGNIAAVVGRSNLCLT